MRRHIPDPLAVDPDLASVAKTLEELLPSVRTRGVGGSGRRLHAPGALLVGSGPPTQSAAADRIGLSPRRTTSASSTIALSLSSAIRADATGLSANVAKPELGRSR